MRSRHGDQASKLFSRSHCTGLGQAAALGRGAHVLDPRRFDRDVKKREGSAVLATVNVLFRRMHGRALAMIATCGQSARFQPEARTSLEDEACSKASGRQPPRFSLATGIRAPS